MKTFSVEEILTRVIQGTPDEDIMRAYKLSPEELKTLYDQLVTAMTEGSPYVQIGHNETGIDDGRAGGLV